MRKKIILFLIVTLSFDSFSQLPKTFIASEQSKEPNYADLKNWVALPFLKDQADIVPNSEIWVSDSLKKVDVFFIHPTLYTRKNANSWTASLSDKKINRKVENQSIKYQASVFNKSCRVYAPKYRQAHVDIFDFEKEFRSQVIDFAYEDVKQAFEYYLKNYNNDRPIIIASHSQGTVHARRLLKDFFDTPKAKEKLVCAYLVGFGVYPKDYTVLSLCQNATETNCFVSWSSFKEGFEYKLSDGDFLVGDTSINPISWTTDTSTAESKSSILLSIKGNKKYSTKARIKDNMLWVDTKTPFVKSWNIMHMVDYNLFWYNIRENVADRVDSYLK